MLREQSKKRGGSGFHSADYDEVVCRRLDAPAAIYFEVEAINFPIADTQRASDVRRIRVCLDLQGVVAGGQRAALAG